MSVDIVSIIIAIVITVVLVVAAYYFLIYNTINTNIDSIQASINVLTSSLTTQNKSIESIPKIQATINESIASLASKVNTNNEETLKSINDMKTANDNLSKSSTSLKDNINTLQSKLDKFIESNITSNNKSNADIASINLKIASLVSNDVVMKATIDGLIVQEKSNLDILETKFPELKSSIDQIKADNEKAIVALQADLNKNDVQDSKYRIFVDKINSYIDNALTTSEISQKVKNRIFVVNDDVLEMYNLQNSEETEAFLVSKYNKVMDCPYSSKDMNDNIMRIMKKIKENKEDDSYYNLFFLFYAVLLKLREKVIDLNFNTMELELSKPKAPQEGKIIIDNTKEMVDMFNKTLAIIGYPPLKNNSSYPYATAKEALKKFMMTLIFDCDKLNNVDVCKKIKIDIDMTPSCETK